MRNKGRSVVLAGRRQPAEVHAIAPVLNAAFGNVGKTASMSPTATASFASLGMAFCVARKWVMQAGAYRLKMASFEASVKVRMSECC